MPALKNERINNWGTCFTHHVSWCWWNETLVGGWRNVDTTFEEWQKTEDDDRKLADITCDVHSLCGGGIGYHQWGVRQRKVKGANGCRRIGVMAKSFKRIGWSGREAWPNNDWMWTQATAKRKPWLAAKTGEKYYVLWTVETWGWIKWNMSTIIFQVCGAR